MRVFLLAAVCTLLGTAARLIAEPPAAAAPVFTSVATLVASAKAHEVLKQPSGVALDPSAGVVYVVDSMHHRVVAVAADGKVLATFGSGKPGLVDGSGSVAQFKEPRGAAFDTVTGTLYVADSGNHVIRRITAAGVVETVAGSGRPAFQDGAGAAAAFKLPAGVTVDALGGVYVADTGNSAVRKISASGVVTSLAGGIAEGFGDGAAAEALFNRPEGVAVAADGSVYIADTGNHRLRKYAGGIVTTVAGTGHGGYADGAAMLAEFHFPAGVAVSEPGRLYVSDRMNHAIRRVTMGDTPVVSTVCGAGKPGLADGAPVQARFHEPAGLAYAGALYVADTKNDALRVIYPHLGIVGVDPSSGDPEGGTPVVITGTGFMPGATRVGFDDAAAPEVTYDSAVTLRVRTPAHAVGRVSVTVTTPAGTATLAEAFEYEPPYVQLVITPAAVTLSRGDTFALRVDGVTSDGSVTNVTAEVSWASSSAGRVAVDAAGVVHALETGSSTVTASLDSLTVSATVVVREPFAELQVVPAATTLEPGETAALLVNGIGFDGSIADVTSRVTWSTSNATIVTVTTAGAATAHAVGTATITATLDTLSAAALITVRPPVPPDPALIAPPLDRTIGTTVFDATRFLYEGPDAIQTGITATIEPRRVSILRGRVLEVDGSGLPGVRVSVPGHPELGSTLTRLDGGFDFVVNGGGTVVLAFAKAGYLPAERSTATSWQQYEVLDDVVVLPLDGRSTRIVSSSAEVQIARGTRVADEDGERQSTLVFPAGTSAAMVMPDGTRVPLDALTLRATEYTVGEMGDEAMPADLPPQTGYTYCVELSADEAIAAGAETVEFSEPAYHYVENFLGFPVGGIVPTGYYDRRKHAWVAAPDGRVVRIVAVSGGAAQLDVNGDGTADGAAALAALGVTAGELQQLASLYSPGQSLWRVPVPHLTPWDHNWPWGAPADAQAPMNPHPTVEGNLQDSQCQYGSVIECENLTLGQSIPIVGTPFTLNYRSDRVPGRRSAYKMTATLSGESVPASLRGIDMTVRVAGRKFKHDFASGTNLQHSFVWDGRDAYGRHVQGPQSVSVSIGYKYRGTYQEPAAGALSFGRFSGSALAILPSRREFVVTQVMADVVQLGVWDQTETGLGGWSISGHQAYVGAARTLIGGDGSIRNRGGSREEVVLRAGFGDGLRMDGVPATEMLLGSVSSIAAAPDGSLYVLHDNCVGRIDPQGLYWNVVNESCLAGFSGDGGPAYSARINPSNGRIAIGPEGSLYIADRGNGRVRRVDPDGNITTFAGTGFIGDRLDGVAATQSRILPAGLAVARDGSVYIGDLRYVRRVSPNGIIATVAGTGNLPVSGAQPAGTPARQTALAFPDALQVEPDGTLLIVDSQRVLRLRPDGRIYNVAGRATSVGGGATSGDGGSGSAARFTWLNTAVPLPDGSIVVSQDNYIRRIDRGVVTRLAGDVDALDVVGAPLDVRMIRPTVAVHPAGGLVIGVDTIDATGYVASMGSILPVYAFEDVYLPDASGRLFHFDRQGRHVATLDADTKAIELTFKYDANGRIAGIVDRNGGRTVVERAGSTIRIVAPRGRTTTLRLNTDGYLEQVTTPAGKSTRFEYDTHGRMLALITPGQRRSWFAYDAEGRLSSHESPTGLHRTLERTATADIAEVTVRTRAGRVWEYIRRRVGTDAVRTSTDPAMKTTSVAVRGDGATQTATLPDGTVVSATAATADERYGMALPVFKSSIKLPSGLQHTATGSRSLTFEDEKPSGPLTRREDRVAVNGRTLAQVHDVESKTLMWTTPAARTATATLNDRGQIVAVELPGLAPVTYEYDTGGLLRRMVQGRRSTVLATDSSMLVTAVTNHVGRETSLTRDADGLVVSMTLPGRRSVAFTHDADGNLLSLTPPGRAAHRFEYAPDGTLSSYVPPGGAPTHFQFTPEGELSGILRPDGKNIGVTYDDHGRVRIVSTMEGQYALDYAANAQLTTATEPGGGRLEYAYDGTVPRSVTWSGPVSGTVSVTLDSSLRVQSQSVNGGASVAFTYDADDMLAGVGALQLRRDPQHGLLSGTTLGTFTDAWTYNTYGERTGYTANAAGAPLVAVTYTRTSSGEIAAISETFAGKTTTRAYGYDDAGRLSGVSIDGIEVAQYVYDSNGNRVSARRTTGGVETASYDLQDRLLAYDDTAFTYSDGGDLATSTVNGETTTYDYDAFGSLRRVAMTGLTIEYVIDAQHRRVGKKRNGIVEQAFLYAGDIRIAAELNGQGQVVSRFVYGSQPHAPDYMVRGGVTYRIVTDHLGSPRFVVDSTTGQVAQQLDYDEFGAVLLDTNPGFQPFGFAGGLYDRDTGLVRFGARDYDARTGRFTTKDRTAFAGGLNLYVYGHNDPINFVDPAGDVPIVVAIVGVGALVGGVTEAIGAYSPGSDAGDVLSAFGRGALAGGVGALVGTGLGLATGNPLLAGSGAGFANEATKQLLLYGGDCWDARALITSTAFGGFLGSFVAGVPAGGAGEGMRTIGRVPNIWKNRPFSKYGPNAIRLLKQELFAGSIGNWLQYGVTQLPAACGCK